MSTATSSSFGQILLVFGAREKATKDCSYLLLVTTCMKIAFSHGPVRRLNTIDYSERPDTAVYQIVDKVAS